MLCPAEEQDDEELPDAKRQRSDDHEEVPEAREEEAREVHGPPIPVTPSLEEVRKH